MWKVLCLLYVAYVFYQWLQVEPRISWQLSSQVDFAECSGEPLLLFGATSMLGRYLVQSIQDNSKKCIVSIARSHCGACDVNIKGDFRDARLIERVMAFYSPSTIITSVKPPLLGMHYKVYIEVNLLSMVQLIDLSIKHKVSNFIYVGSIAAAGHYFEHNNGNEVDSMPFYTDLEAPYDVSKRFAEDYLLSKQSDVFNTISIRLGGVIGGDGDPFEHLRYPFLFKYSPSPPGIDVNFAGNIAAAISVVLRKMESLSDNCGFCGEFYYYTGEPMTENEKADIVAAATGKPVLTIPLAIVETLARWLHWARFEVNVYSEVDLMRMALVPQTFDQTKFMRAFPEFTEPMTLAEGLKLIYSAKQEPKGEL